MNGAQSVVGTLLGSGVEVCFANPGTSEMHFVAALEDAAPDGTRMRAVLGLFEGVVTGMADGYGRMAGKPAVTLLHLGPGLANGLANLHNARRAGTPVVNIVGDHATYHVQYDAPLTSDVEGVARPMSDWVHTSTGALAAAADTARAVQAAMQYPRQVATLILPADAAWSPAEGSAPALPFAAPAPVADAAIARVAGLLGNGRGTAILLAGDSLGEQALLTAGRIAAATGARLLCDTFTPRLPRGAGRVPIERIPYFAEQIVGLFAQIDQVVLVGAKAPVAFFAYPDKPSKGLADSTTVSVLAHPHEDGPAALTALAEAVGALRTPVVLAERQVDGSTEGRFDQFGIGRIIAAHLPEGAIVSEEAATSSLGSQIALVTSVPHEVLSLMGGSIGQGLPLATGAAVACPDRKVVCLHGDGGAMYTLQALWTQARERLDVTTVVFANRRYAILDIELGRVGATGNEVAGRMFDLADPELQWVDLARGMGVEGVRVTTLAEFSAAFASAMRSRGPRLIEVMV